MRIQGIPWLNFSVPQRKLDMSIAVTFAMGNYQTARTTQPVTLFRVTTAPVKGGAYWTTEQPKNRMDVKMSMALLPEWNQRQYYQTAVLPVGTEVQVGFAAPQGSSSYWQHVERTGSEENVPYGRDLTGGCVQVFMEGGMPEQYVIESGIPLEFSNNYSEFDKKATEIEKSAERERAEAAKTTQESVQEIHIKRAPMTKSVSEQVKSNAKFTQRDENGQIVSPNRTGQVIDENVQTDIGHDKFFENKYEVKYSEKAGMTQQEHNQMFTNPGQFQVEPSKENRSHVFENHSENDAMMNISAYACGEDKNVAANTMIIPPENGSSMGTLAVKNAQTGEMESLATFPWTSPERSENVDALSGTAQSSESKEKLDEVQEKTVLETECAETSKPITEDAVAASKSQNASEDASEQEKADERSELSEADIQETAKASTEKSIDNNAEEAVVVTEKPEESVSKSQNTSESAKETVLEQEKANAQSESLKADTQEAAKTNAEKFVDNNFEEASSSMSSTGGSGSRFETGNTSESGKNNGASDDYYYGYY